MDKLLGLKLTDCLQSLHVSPCLQVVPSQEEEGPHHHNHGDEDIWVGYPGKDHDGKELQQNL